jgi:uncharacterized membrane protein
MKRLLLAFVTFVTILLFSASCYYDNEESLYPSLNSSCDTTNVTFSAKIIPILTNNCLSCHSNATAASAGNNIRLQDYIDVKARITAIAGSIKHAGSFSPMPKNGGQLNACSITLVDIWIRNGAPDN